MANVQEKWIACLASLVVALLAACAILLVRGRSAPSALNQQALLADPEVRKGVIAKLTRATVSVFDSHNDPDVGRVLLANLVDVQATDVPVTTNNYGLRERPFELPKPEGVLRIVIVGDSHIMGYGTTAEQRVGVHLERYLQERARAYTGKIECLHVGVGGWNAVNECRYVRRLLSELAPELVVQLTVSNDLDDPLGVRGFGGLSAFTPRAPERTDAVVSLAYPVQFSEPKNANYLLLGLDWESRHRFEEAVDEFARLAAAIEQTGARYLLVGHWGAMNDKISKHLGEGVARESQLFLPATLYYDPALRLSETDSHLNGAGHERVARVLFGVIRERGLLPQLGLEPWPEAEEISRKTLTEGLAEIEKKQTAESKTALMRGIAGGIRFEQMTLPAWRQVYTGIDGERRASPYLSVILRNAQPGPGRVRVRGRTFDRPEMQGMRIAVRVENESAGEFVPELGAPFDHVFDLPPGAQGQPCVTLNLQASDYVYVGPNRQHCVSFELVELAIEPP